MTHLFKKKFFGLLFWGYRLRSEITKYKCMTIVISYHCYGLQFVSPPKFTCWNINSQRDSIRRWGIWEVIGISGLVRWDAEVCLLSLSALPAMWGCYSWKGNSLQTRKSNFVIHQRWSVPGSQPSQPPELGEINISLWHSVRADRTG